ncbi:MAG: hypothetical protein AB1942_25845 [Pseudomonadota bacterium]
MRLETIALAAALLAGAAHAQSAYKAPRNAFGQPDFEGVWTNASLTSLERPAHFKSLIITDAQARAAEAMRAKMMDAQSKPTDPNAGAPKAGEDPGGYNAFWTDAGTRYGRIRGEVRTSWLVEPADGKLPYKPEGYKLYQDTLSKVRNSFDGPEGRPLGERCILGFGSTAGPPMLNVLYNNHYQVQQAKDHVVIVVEMNHDARIIRLADPKRPPAHIRTWMGDSVGRWEGDTLVVETEGFQADESLRPYFGASLYLSPEARVTERFTRISADQILYEFSVDDPKVYSRVWKAEMALNAAKGPMYEYACHEGNYSLPGILAGARKAEAEGRKPESVDITE